MTSPECFATTTVEAAEPAPGTVASTRMWSPGRAEVTYEIRQVWPSRSAIERYTAASAPVDAAAKYRPPVSRASCCSGAGSKPCPSMPIG